MNLNQCIYMSALALVLVFGAPLSAMEQQDVMGRQGVRKGVSSPWVRQCNSQLEPLPTMQQMSEFQECVEGYSNVQALIQCGQLTTQCCMLGTQCCILGVLCCICFKLK